MVFALYLLYCFSFTGHIFQNPFVYTAVTICYEVGILDIVHLYAASKPIRNNGWFPVRRSVAYTPIFVTRVLFWFLPRPSALAHGVQYLFLTPMYRTFLPKPSLAHNRCLKNINKNYAEQWRN